MFEQTAWQVLWFDSGACDVCSTEVSDSGKRFKNKYRQQGIRGIFVGFPEDSSGWFFYVPDTKRTYISLDAVFDENFTSPLSMPELPFQGALKIRGTIFLTQRY